VKTAVSGQSRHSHRFVGRLFDPAGSTPLQPCSGPLMNFCAQLIYGPAPFPAVGTSIRPYLHTLPESP
jgi:hypothetical protein